ncbi:HK97-gp10 family putative phage morphogenesis protein [Hymenobacter cheonanensis]|uniref:HK97-gp10 family putative phage morphogenesis protein n=1 Tax=Hymenobacter sp. CA2-7 TaxID=3063993 RepID=UPI0027123009|nr:HK97-gp10 family putative phage morphogenesis protein [Hymenobacter sp. CA2-7]MDO7888285.1 HK97 gp10 family phage protein [Hymenobacter sp. CA2-7]
MGKNLSFVGIEELSQVLDGLAGDKKLSGKVVRGILGKAAKPIIQKAQELAPKEDGDLQKSIGTIPGRGQGKGEQVYVGPRRGGRYKGYAGHLVEYGTAPHLIRAKAAGGQLHLRGNVFVEQVHHPGAAAKPFMRPAFDSKKDEAIGIIKDECRIIIESEFKSIKF